MWLGLTSGFNNLVVIKEVVLIYLQTWTLFDEQAETSEDFFSIIVLNKAFLLHRWGHFQWFYLHIALFGLVTWWSLKLTLCPWKSIFGKITTAWKSMLEGFWKKASLTPENQKKGWKMIFVYILEVELAGTWSHDGFHQVRRFESPFPGLDFQVKHVKLQGCGGFQKW